MNQLETKRKILKYLMRKSPFQPATNFWRAIEVQFLSTVLPKSGKVLDLGCGDGELSKILSDCVQDCTWELVGTDIDAREIEYARLLNLYSDLQICPASKMPFPNSTFDFVYSNSVLEHIPNLEESINEISRCLKHSGKLFATVPSENFHKCLSAKAKWIGENYYEQIDRRLQHHHYLSKEEWAKMLEAHGFKLISAQPYLSKKQIQRWEFCSNWTAGILYKLFNKNKSPLEIQNCIGLKKEANKLFFPVLDIISKLLFDGLLEDSLSEDFGAYLITAIKY